MDSSSNLACRLIAESLQQASPHRPDLWNEATARAERVVANGLPLPIVRIEWNQIDDFFDTLFDRANAELFRSSLPPCRRTWNRRFRSVAGRIECRSRTIELSSAHFEACGVAALGAVLIHEMIHLYLFEQRMPYGHNSAFKIMSRSAGLPSVYHELPLPTRLKRQRSWHLYRCSCGIELRSRVRFRTPRACASCCRRFNRSRYDERYRLQYVGRLDTRG